MATRPRYFPDLRSYADHLERAGLLRRVQAEVDPVLEVPEIVQRVYVSAVRRCFSSAKGIRRSR